MSAIELLQRQIDELVKRVKSGESSPFTVKVTMPEFAQINQYFSENPNGADHLVPNCLLFAEVKYEVVY